MKDSYQKLSVYHFANDIKKYRTKDRLRVVIFGNFGAKNTGDDAILSGQLHELRLAMPTSVTVIARFPQEVEKMHKVRAISMFSFFKVFQAVWDAEAVIIGGGGLISRVERQIIGFLYQLYMLFAFFGLPLALGKPTFALGLGVYDNTNRFNLAIAAQLLGNLKKVTVRDFHSFALLRQMQVPVEIYKDNSFLLDLPAKQEIASASFFRKFYSAKRKNIAFSLIAPENKEAKESLVREIVQFVKQNYKNSDFWFYSLDHHTSYANDKAFGQQIQAVVKKEIGNVVSFHFIPENWVPEQVFGSFQLMDFIVTQRLHGAIFAYRLGVSFAGISYDKKCTSFLNSIGKNVLEARNVTSGQIQAQLRQKKRKQAILSSKRVSNSAFTAPASVL